ncbi:hypothetical protein [Methanoregula sp.]|nr:hypothetical protein [Methanoregula sp.]
MQYISVNAGIVGGLPVSVIIPSVILGIIAAIVVFRISREEK